jgi:hypothetical protein
MLFKFYQECDDLEKWMKDQERLLKTTPENESVADAKMKFEVSSIHQKTSSVLFS